MTIEIRESMKTNELILHAVFVACAALFIGTERDCMTVAESMCAADVTVADTLKVGEY